MKKGDIIKYESDGMYPQCDGRYYRVMGNHLNYTNIKTIQEINYQTYKYKLTEPTQVIAFFSGDVPNKYIIVVGSIRDARD